MTFVSTSSSLYARAARSVRAHPFLGVAIVLGSSMHAAGHALIAAAGGHLARVLASDGPLGNARSIPLPEALRNVDPLLVLGFVGVLAATAKLLGGVMAAWAEARVAGEVGAALRLELVDRLLAANSVRGTRQNDHGRRTAALTAHVADVEKGIAGGVFGELRAYVQLVPLAALLAVLAPRLAGSAGIALVAFGLLVHVTRRALKRRHAQAAHEADVLHGAADEAVRHADLWRTFGAQGRVRAHLAALGRTIVDTAALLRARGALLSATSELLGALALVLVLALVSAGAIGGVDRGAILPFSIAFFMAYKPLREIVEARLSRAKAEEALAHVVARDPDDRVEPTPEKPSASPTRAWSLGVLAIEGLVTEHGAHAPLSVRIPPGKIAAIVGPTGIGKTSLLRALLGLDVPRAGRIEWDGEDLAKRAVGPTERPFAWVPQDAPMLGDTLAVNVLLGARTDDAGARDDCSARAARLLAELGAGDLAASVGDAVLATDRPVSGGERQWIAVARALATGLPVVVLDEPTSALDPAAQEKMLRAIERLRGSRTVILVTHRKEPLAIADVIVRLTPASRGDDAQHGPGRDRHLSGVEELAVEHVRTIAAREPKVRALR